MVSNQTVLIRANARHIPLTDNSVQAVVTSPPYRTARIYEVPDTAWGGDDRCEHVWQKREFYSQQTPRRKSAEAFIKAGPENAELVRETRNRKDAICQHCGAWLGQLGLEPRPELYVEHLVEVCQEIHRVLKPDGTFWLNLGGGYYSDPRKGGSGTPNGRNGRGENYGRAAIVPTSLPLKPKDLILLEARVALALQEDGWWVRDDLIWQKLNGMPGGKPDRIARTHEYIFLLAKSDRYYFDPEAVPKSSIWSTLVARGTEGHYATMPQLLAEYCILAGSEPGGLVLDPFCGTGTTGRGAERRSRRFVGVELSTAYLPMAQRQTSQMGL
jgi:DNA modification methylase